MKGSIHGIGDLNISPFSFGVTEADCFTGLVETWPIVRVLNANTNLIPKVPLQRATQIHGSSHIFTG